MWVNSITHKYTQKKVAGAVRVRIALDTKLFISLSTLDYITNYWVPVCIATILSSSLIILSELSK